MKGFQKPLDDGTRKDVRIATISKGEGYHICSCGSIFTHAKPKTQEKMASKHVDKKHHGQALWL